VCCSVLPVLAAATSATAPHGVWYACTLTRCNTVQHTATHCNTLLQHAEHAATRCNTLQCTAQRQACVPIAGSAAAEASLHCVAVCCTVLRCVAVCCSVLQCAAVCCSVLQCAAVLLRPLCTCRQISYISYLTPRDSV